MLPIASAYFLVHALCWLLLYADYKDVSLGFTTTDQRTKARRVLAGVLFAAPLCTALIVRAALRQGRAAMAEVLVDARADATIESNREGRLSLKESRVK